MKFANNVDTTLAVAATNVTAIISATNMRFVGPVTSTLRAALSPDCAFTFQAPTSPVLAPFLREHVAMLLLICRVDLC